MDDSSLDGVSVQNSTNPPRSEAYAPDQEASRLQRVPPGQRHARQKQKRSRFGRSNKDKVDNSDNTGSPASGAEPAITVPQGVLPEAALGRDAGSRQEPAPRLQRDAPPRANRRRLIAAVLLVLAVVFLGTTGWLAYEVHGTSAASGQRDAVLVAARQEATDLTTLSKQTGASDFDAVLAGSAGELKQQLSSAGKSAFLKALSSGKVSSVGTVLDAGITTLKPSSSATVLLSVRATVTNSQTGKPETRLYHWQASLVYSAGRWLVTKLEFM